MSEHERELSPTPGVEAESPLAALDAAFKLDDEGVEVFDMDAVIPSKRRWSFDGHAYLIPNAVPIDLMLQFLSYEEQDENASTQETLQKLVATEQKIHDFLAEHNADVPDKLNLGPTRLPIAITYLMRGRSATEVALEMLMGGGLARMEEALRAAEQLAEVRGDIEADTDPGDGLAPLASEKRSSRRSSRSRSGTAGSPAGGKKKTSGRSPSTSKQPAATG